MYNVFFSKCMCYDKELSFKSIQLDNKNIKDVRSQL